MAHPDAFALKNAAVSPFLYSEVGLELNGSTLTVLSTLARLGEDPWVQALNWTKLPMPAIIDQLAERIRRMPLPPQALLDARATASRLSSLLPEETHSLAFGNGMGTRMPAVPKSARLPIFYVILVFVIAMNMAVVSARHGSLPVQTEQSAALQVPSAVGTPQNRMPAGSQRSALPN